MIGDGQISSQNCSVAAAAVTDGDADDLMTVGVAALHSDDEATSISAPPAARGKQQRAQRGRLRRTDGRTSDVDLLNTAPAAGGAVVYICRRQVSRQAI